MRRGRAKSKSEGKPAEESSNGEAALVLASPERKHHKVRLPQPPGTPLSAAAAPHAVLSTRAITDSCARWPHARAAVRGGAGAQAALPRHLHARHGQQEREAHQGDHGDEAPGVSGSSRSSKCRGASTSALAAAARPPCGATHTWPQGAAVRGGVPAQARRGKRQRRPGGGGAGRGGAGGRVGQHRLLGGRPPARSGHLCAGARRGGGRMACSLLGVCMQLGTQALSGAHSVHSLSDCASWRARTDVRPLQYALC